MTTSSDLLKKFGNRIANLKGWEVVPLENVLKLITYGLTVRPKYHTQGIPLVSATQIRNGVVDLESAPRISVDDYEKLSDKCKARPGNILFAKTGTIGHCAICHSDEKVALAQNVARLVFDETQIETKFALRYLRTPFIQDLAKRSAKGNAVQDLQLGEIRKFPIPLPPLEEQRRIATILDKADAVRRKRKEAIALTEELLRSAFLEMFGDPVTNPKGWKVGKVIDYCDCIVPGRDKPKSFTGDIPWVTTADLNYLDYTYVSRSRIGLTVSEISQVNARVIPRESVLLTCVGDLGVTSIAGKDLVVNQQLHTFQCKEINNSFLMYALIFQKGFMYQMATQTTVPYMNKTTCNNIPVIYPPLELQEKFALICRNINESNKKLYGAFQESDNLFNSLLQRAFRGEL